MERAHACTRQRRMKSVCRHAQTDEARVFDIRDKQNSTSRIPPDLATLTQQQRQRLTHTLRLAHLSRSSVSHLAMSVVECSTISTTIMAT